ncbi:XdhC family protein [Paraburkholderia phenoliruptrix]|uniref:XdhC family protein n=1 Tax=Paraburkholderia phenoliruptrix TaxID=252970 RepID=UPI002869DAAD|nr:XdhC family protein [Paraburkholderia phenoliruptrix]WMY09545.1 XdhC family protein [Paraburkholderia phenoliruptrix]
MDSLDRDVLSAAVMWQRAGKTVALGTVIRTWGSAPRPVGSMVAIRSDGALRGSVSGGCIEDDLILRVKTGELPGALPCEVTYGLSADEAHRFGLPCGGTLKLIVEPVGPASGLELLLELTGRGAVVCRALDMSSGRAAIRESSESEDVQFDGQSLRTVHGPQYRLVIVGAGQLSEYVAHMAVPLGYRVIVCDPREEYAAEWPVAHTEVSREMPDDLLIRIGLDRHTAVVTLTHDPKLDDLALIEALKSDAFYVGAIGSRSNNSKRRARLRLFELGDAQIARLRGPIGLYIGAQTPPEIAVSILAEMISMRYCVPVLQGHEMRETPAQTVHAA